MLQMRAMEFASTVGRTTYAFGDLRTLLARATPGWSPGSATRSGCRARYR
jgi:hypothetical protein